jgi:uncharacterized membrane protein
MRKLALLLVAAALSACQPQAPDGAPAQAPADAPPPTPDAPPVAGPFGEDIDLRGTEPFWGVQIRQAGLTLTRPDQDPVMANNPGPKVEGGKAVWTAQTDQGPMTITLETATCSDGMSDLTYPYTATVVFAGQTLKGCGLKALPMATGN